MRTREEIENSGMKSGNTFYGDPRDKLILEVLLDIRDLLDVIAHPIAKIGNNTPPHHE